MNYHDDRDEGSGTRESWRRLALQLRHQLDNDADRWRTFVGWVALFAYFLGLVSMWLVIKYHIYY